MRIPPGAVWIGSDHPFDLQEAYLNFRADFELGRKAETARLFITADSRYKLWVNGAYVGRGPSRCWPQAQQIDSIDIAPHLKPGLNTVAVQVYSPGYSHFAYLHRGSCGLLAWLEADGETILAPGPRWRVRRDNSWRSTIRRVSIYGTGVERRDMREEHPWTQASTDGEDWKTPRMLQPANGPLWSGLTLRDVPLLEERSLAVPEGSVQFLFGEAARLADDPHEAMREAWQLSALREGQAGRARLQANDFCIWVFDLGRSHTGQARIRIKGAHGGERLLVSYAEKKRDGKLVIPDPSTYCRMRPTDEFILREGEQLLEPFSQRGGRYILVCLYASQLAEVTLDFEFLTTVYPLEAKGVRAADRRLEDIAALCRRSVEACLQDGFVDSVWRESSQWLGDCVTEAFALAAISDDARPLRRAITMAAAGAYPDGVLPSVLPGEVHAYTVVDYNFSWVELLAQYRSHPGANDARELLAQMAPALRRMLERFDEDRDDSGVIHSQPGRRLFLDWSPVDRREPNLTYNARYLHALQLAADIAQTIGDHDLQQLCSARAERLTAAMRNVFSTGADWRENTHGTPASQLALALVVLTGCADANGAPSLCKAIIARSMDLRDDHGEDRLVLASPFMHHYVFLALEKHGFQGAILDIIRARWGRWAEAGEATTWENWNIDFPDGSACHAFSAHPLGWIARCAGSS
jgi:hypothetical protein